jgi:hypothetical protein
MVVFDGHTCVDGATEAADITLYDDGTHGDDFAGDGVYSRGCLHLCAHPGAYDIHGFARSTSSLGGRLVVVDDALRGTVPIVDLPTPAAKDVTVQATAHAIFFADTDRAHMPDWPRMLPRDSLWTGNAIAARAATSVFGDVFDYVTMYPMEPCNLGGGGIMKWQEWTLVGGPNRWEKPTDVGTHSDCMRALDGVEHPKVKGIIWISEPHSLWSGVLEHELLHGAAGFGYHSRVDAARNGDGMHVPGACTDDHSVLQGPVWDWVEGAPYAIDGSDGSGSVCLVANDDCATCDDPENGGCCTFRYADKPRTVEEFLAHPELQAASDMLLYVGGFVPYEDVADHSKVGYCIGTDTDGGCGAREGKEDCDPDIWVDDADRDAITSNHVGRFTFEELAAAAGGPRDPPAKRDSAATRQAVVYLSGRVPEEAEWTYRELFWRYYDSMTEPIQTTAGTIMGWRYTTKGTNVLQSRLHGVPCGDSGHLVGCEPVAADACDAHACHEHARCRPVDGGYVCVCGDGYYGDGLSCVEPDATDGYPLESVDFLVERGWCGFGQEDHWYALDPTLHERPYPGGVAPYSPISCGDDLCPLGDTCDPDAGCVAAE